MGSRTRSEELLQKPVAGIQDNDKPRPEFLRRIKQADVSARTKVVMVQVLNRAGQRTWSRLVAAGALILLDAGSALAFAFADCEHLADAADPEPPGHCCSPEQPAIGPYASPIAVKNYRRTGSGAVGVT